MGGRPVDRLLRGAAQGTVATVVMSVPRLVAERLGQVGRQPPEAIVRRAGEVVGQEPHGCTTAVLGGVAHLAFGAGVGG